jgi:hypothetical protein
MSPEMHDRVMNRASRLWHEHGKPNGRYREFWEEAHRELLHDDHPESNHVDDLATWAPATPLPSRSASTPRRLTQFAERSLRRVMHRF